MGVNDTISTFNATVRTLLATAVVGGLGIGGWIGYSKYNESEFTEKALEQAQQDVRKLRDQLQQKDVELVEKQEEIDSLAAAMLRLKYSQQLGKLTVKAVITDPETEKKISEVEFVQLTGQGEPIGEPKTFTIKGDMIYIDYWVVKFEDKYIEEGGDLDRSTSLCLFHRIFGEFQQPIDGYTLESASSQPNTYERGGKLSELEQKIWGDFWTVANDPAMQEQMGIRAAHGEAVSMKMVKGKTYLLTLRASDGITIDEASSDSVARNNPSL